MPLEWFALDVLLPMLDVERGEEGGGGAGRRRRRRRRGGEEEEGGLRTEEGDRIAV